MFSSNKNFFNNKKISKKSPIQKISILKLSMNKKVLDNALLCLLYSEAKVKKLLSSTLFNFYNKVTDFDKIPDNELALKYKVINICIEEIKLKNYLTNNLFDSIINKLNDFENEPFEQMINDIIKVCEEEDDGELDPSYIIRAIEDKISILSLYQYKDIIIEKLSELDLGTINDVRTYGEEVKVLTESLASELRKSVSIKDDKSKDFVIGYSQEEQSLNSFYKVTTEAIDELNNPLNILKSGNKLHNDQLGGGWQLGRFYLYAGVSGGGKSLQLLRVAKQIQTNNPLSLFKNNSDLKSCVLYIGMENSQTETLERIFDLFLPPEIVKQKHFKDYSPDDIYKLFDEHINSDDKFAVAIRYRRNKSINTADVDSMIDELKEDGLDIKAIIIDYTKRILPVSYSGDLRLDLGNVVDELTAIAKTRNVAIISAAQLNGNAMHIVEEAASNGNLQALDKVTSSAVGESKLMIENSDFVILINSTKSISLDRSFICYKIIKRRAKANKKFENTIYYPYESSETPQVLEDFYLDEVLGLININDIVKQNAISKFENNSKEMLNSSNKRNNREALKSLLKISTDIDLGEDGSITLE
jgi:replicative DNA helicase